MIQKETLKAQHSELIGMVGELSRELDPTVLKHNASKASDMLKRFTSRLQFHLNMEDKFVYPMLLIKDNEDVKTITRNFVEEMGSLLEAYTEFAGKWDTPEKIEAGPEGFVSEIKGIFAALGRRIEKEDKELYTLLGD